NEVHSLIYSRIENEIEREERKSSRRSWNWIGVAASVVLVCFAGLYFSKTNEKQNANATVAVIKPGSNEAILTLADGSKVRLNAASSIKFPTVFSGKQRNVELKGEGYFEVAKNKAKPFIVSTGNQRVEVLGTHFNVNAYGDDGVTRTTLLEGSVQVAMANRSSS